MSKTYSITQMPNDTMISIATTYRTMMIGDIDTSAIEQRFNGRFKYIITWYDPVTFEPTRCFNDTLTGMMIRIGTAFNKTMSEDEYIIGILISIISDTRDNRIESIL